MKFDEFTDRLFEGARSAGFEECEVYESRGESFRVMVFEGKVDDYKVNTSFGLSFRGMKNGRMGYAYTEVLDEDAVSMLLRSAADNAAVIESEDPQFIFAGAGKEDYKPVEAYYPALAQLTPARKIELTLEMEAAALRADPRITTVEYCMLQYGDGSVRIRNSRGLDLSERSNDLFAYLEPVAEADGKREEGHAYRITHDPDGLEPEAMAREAAENALTKLGAAPVPSGSYDILLGNEAAGDMLSAFSDIFSADAAQKGLSLLKGRVGETIAAPCVTLMDDPHLRDGFASAGFDAEGVPTCTKAVIDGGVLGTLLHNLKTAAKDGTTSTGNAAKRSYKSPVGVSPFNFYVKPGDAPPEALMRRMGRGLMITEVVGLHSGTDTVSGDFSLMGNGFVIEEGRRGRPVDQITIAGNFFMMLKAIEAVGSDLRFGLPGTGCVGSPSLWVRELSVAGK